MGTRITMATAWEALDSRGRPTVACHLRLANGAAGRVLVPSGASAGSHEALELRDGGDRYQGFGVTKAVRAVNQELRAAVVGIDARDHGAVDANLRAVVEASSIDQIGANATLAVSLAAVVAAANSADNSVARYLSGDAPLEIPMPMVNIVSGGTHADDAIDIQDFLVIPIAAKTFRQAIEWAQRIRFSAMELTRARGYREAGLVADEGGIGVRFPTNESVLELLVEAIEFAGLQPGTEVGIAIDAAASEFHVDDTYRFASEDKSFTASQLLNVYAGWVRDYPIISIEDAFAEDDWSAWKIAASQLAERIDLVGDDLFVTQNARLTRGIDESAATAILVKPNQNGLFSDTQEVLTNAKQGNLRTIVSARSGDTEDSWLADLAVGWRAGQIKVGSTQRSERTAKWNRLLEFEALERTIFADPWNCRS